jgi:hypothetical protein
MTTRQYAATAAGYGFDVFGVGGAAQRSGPPLLCEGVRQALSGYLSWVVRFDRGGVW